ncbi:Hypothetical protein SRAE_2000421200 [Strongyloides ratti]|uniref:Uncharacterized protein n=1 Tax=Strongyloides ratti TaxID=34506 RepID=A0A090MZU9_STRRB|nr:Hypothetical protein SRAE_2000421200 [Strongyloides ratti]CEF69564.1 Hypothetical protein SRAE_2000421200 [Strongyloides ratti]
MADKSAYVPPEALDGSNGGIKKDSSDVDLDDVDFFAKPAQAPAPAKKPPVTPPPVVAPTPPVTKASPIQPKKPTIVYKKATNYQKTFAGNKN